MACGILTCAGAAELEGPGSPRCATELRKRRCVRRGDDKRNLACHFSSSAYPAPSLGFGCSRRVRRKQGGGSEQPHVRRHIRRHTRRHACRLGIAHDESDWAGREAESVQRAQVCPPAEVCSSTSSFGMRKVSRRHSPPSPHCDSQHYEALRSSVMMEECARDQCREFGQRFLSADHPSTSAPFLQRLSRDHHGNGPVETTFIGPASRFAAKKALVARGDRGGHFQLRQHAEQGAGRGCRCGRV